MDNIQYAVEMKNVSKIYKLKKKGASVPGAERSDALKDVAKGALLGFNKKKILDEKLKERIIVEEKKSFWSWLRGKQEI